MRSRWLVVGLIAVFMAVLVLAGCGPQGEEVASEGEVQAPEITEEHVFDSGDKIGFVPPEGWNADNSGAMGSIITASEPDPGVFAVNITTVTEAAPGYGLEEYVDAAIRGAEQGLENYNMISRKTVKMPSGDAVEMVITHTYSGIDIKAKQTAFMNDGEAVIFTLSALPDNFDENVGAFDEAMKTVVFK